MVGSGLMYMLVPLRSGIILWTNCFRDGMMDSFESMDWSPVSTMNGASSAADIMMMNRATRLSITTRTNFHNEGYTEGAVKEKQ